MVSDGQGGGIVVWYDFRSGTNSDIYAQRVNGAGLVQWTVDGVAICTAVGDQLVPQIIADGSGGAIMVWEDRRSDVSPDIFAQGISAGGLP